MTVSDSIDSLRVALVVAMMRLDALERMLSAPLSPEDAAEDDVPIEELAAVRPEQDDGPNYCEAYLGHFIRLCAAEARGDADAIHQERQWISVYRDSLVPEEREMVDRIAMIALKRRASA